MSGSAQPDRKTAVDRAAEQLRGAILAGAYPPGTVLPAERTLAVELGISRLTLRAALARLHAEGLIESVHGSGTRVLDFRQSGGLELLGPLLRLVVERGELPVRELAELLQVRLALAVEAIGLAAIHASPAELQALEDHLAVLRAAAPDAAAFMQADLQFARLVTQAAHNLPLELIWNSVQRTLRGSQGAELLFSAGDSAATLEVYRALVRALRERNPGRARRLTRRLLARHDDHLLEQLGQLALGPTAALAEVGT